MLPLGLLTTYGAVCRLKKEYIAWCNKLGATGAGLDPELVSEGTNIANIIGEQRPDIFIPHVVLITSIQRRSVRAGRGGTISMASGVNCLITILWASSLRSRAQTMRVQHRHSTVTRPGPTMIRTSSMSSTIAPKRQGPMPAGIKITMVITAPTMTPFRQTLVKTRTRVQLLCVFVFGQRDRH